MEQFLELSDIITGLDEASKKKKQEKKRKSLDMAAERIAKRRKSENAVGEGGIHVSQERSEETHKPKKKKKKPQEQPAHQESEISPQKPGRTPGTQGAQGKYEEDIEDDEDDVEYVERDFEADFDEDEAEIVEFEPIQYQAGIRHTKKEKAPKEKVSKEDGETSEAHAGLTPKEIKKAERLKKRLQRKEAKEEWDWSQGKVHPDILKALAEVGIKKATPIQRAVLRPALEGCCILAAAQTGSGKTLAFGVPVLHRIMIDIARSGDDPEHRLMSCLVLSPTRELAMQIKDHLCQAAKYLPIQIIALVGGMSEQKQLRLLLKGRPHIVVATPGRLCKLFTEDNVPFLHESISVQLRYLVIDEGDRMLEMHHFQEIDEVLSHLGDAPTDKSWGELQSMKGILKDNDRTHEGKAAKQVRTFTSCFEEYDDVDDFMDAANSTKKKLIRYLLPSLEGDASQEARKQTSKGKGKVKKLARRQVFIMSATMTLSTRWKDGTKKIRKWNPSDPDGAYMHSMVSRIGLPLRAFRIIDVNPSHQTAESLSEMKVECSFSDRDYFLYYFLITYPGRTIIFVNAVSAVRRLAAILKILNLPCYPMHAQMEQRRRLKYYDLFRDDDRAIIVATDVVGRGTDVKNVKYVVHYQFPRNTEIYLHRCGRTARAEKVGLAVALLTPPDMSNYKQVCYSLGYKKGLDEFPVDTTLFREIKNRVRLACDIDKLVNAKTKSQYQKDWYLKTARAMEVDLDDDLRDSFKEDPHDRKVREKKIRVMEKELKQLLAQPLNSSKGAYLSSASNIIRRQMHHAALAYRVELGEEKQDNGNPNEEEERGGDEEDVEHEQVGKPRFNAPKGRRGRR